MGSNCYHFMYDSAWAVVMDRCDSVVQEPTMNSAQKRIIVTGGAGFIAPRLWIWERGWLAGWREWLRWATLIVRASPRLCVYAAAIELSAHLPSGMRAGRSGDKQEDWAAIRSWLPV